MSLIGAVVPKVFGLIELLEGYHPRTVSCGCWYGWIKDTWPDQENKKIVFSFFHILSFSVIFLFPRSGDAVDVEPDHDVEPALTLFSHVRPLRQDSHNTEGRDDKNSQKKISSNQFGLLQHQSRFSILMQVYTLMLFLKALHDFKMLNDSSLIGGARLHWPWPYLSMLVYLCIIFQRLPKSCLAQVGPRFWQWQSLWNVSPSQCPVIYSRCVFLVMWCLHTNTQRYAKGRKGTWKVKSNSNANVL